MIIYYPASLYNLAYRIEPSTQWKRNAGWSKPRAFPMLFSGSYVSEVLSDPFIQKGKGKFTRKDCYHCKLPLSYTYVSQKSLEFWCRAHNLWSGYDISEARTLYTPMYDTGNNGICYAYCYQVFQNKDTWIYAECTPARGVRSNFWSIGNIYYREYRPIPNPGRYQIQSRSYTAKDSTKFPWLGNQSYDSTKVEMAIMANFDPTKFPSWSAGFATKYAYEEYATPNFTSNLFDEDRRITGIPTSRGEYELDWLINHAFYDACEGIGKANDNTIQNIVGIVTDLVGICETFGMGGLELASDAGKASKKLSFKKRLKKYYLNHDVVEVADTASSSWLKYRYQYCTSVMDMKEYGKYLNHKVDRYFDFLNKNYHEVVYGVATRNVNGRQVKCTCQLAYRPRTFEGLKTAMRYIHDAGLEVNPYVLWDYIPYSFVVDWFLPIGDIASVISDQKYYTSEYYDFEFCGFSISYDDEVGHRYYRWYQSPPDLDVSYWFDKGGKKASTKLKLKRTADVVSLIVG